MKHTGLWLYYVLEYQLPTCKMLESVIRLQLNSSLSIPRLYWWSCAAMYKTALSAEKNHFAFLFVSIIYKTNDFFLLHRTLFWFNENNNKNIPTSVAVHTHNNEQTQKFLFTFYGYFKEKICVGKKQVQCLADMECVNFNKLKLMNKKKCCN